MTQITDLIKTQPQLIHSLFPHLTEEQKAELPLTRDVNIRAVMQIDRGWVQGGMSIQEFTRLRPEGGVPVEVVSQIKQDVNIPDAIVFDMLMYALNKFPEIGEQIVAILGFMPAVVPPDSLQNDLE
ncbi:hypothetical protein [Telluribacter humicola]|uniref:hypothetical protein n=1 Tax=Telluribacter humicola TaxID=1720261 RepID=UPI001A966BE5|nr:hypothetical protein [Telluribacter humicola]